MILAVTPLKVPPTSPLSPVEAELKLRRLGELATERVVASLSKAVNPESRLVPGDPGQVLEAEGERDLDPRAAYARPLTSGPTPAPPLVRTR